MLKTILKKITKKQKQIIGVSIVGIVVLIAIIGGILGSKRPQQPPPFFN